jgi:hypothetical protein
MANWQNVYDEKSDSFLNSYNGFYESTVTGKVYASLQYDAETISTTSVTLRFKLHCTPVSNYYDEYHVLLDPENANNRSLHLLKSDYTQKWNDTTAINKWPYYAKKADGTAATFTSTKTAKDTKFPIPAFWLINDGWNNTTTETALAFYNKYKDGGARGPSLRSTIAATTVEIAKDMSVATDGGRPSISITDNGDNTVTISGTLGINGANNNMTHAALYYTTDGSDPSVESNTKRKRVSLTASSGTNYSNTITITSACTVEAFVKCVFAYNTTTATANKAAKYYAAPNAPGAPVLSYNKSRLTVKEPLTFTWTAATAKNTNSPVAGYYFMLLRKRSGDASYSYVREITCSTDDNYLGISPGTNSNNKTNPYENNIKSKKRYHLASQNLS